jgi:hypothetical protein
LRSSIASLRSYPTFQNESCVDFQFESFGNRSLAKRLIWQGISPGTSLAVNAHCDPTGGRDSTIHFDSYLPARKATKEDSLTYPYPVRQPA